MGIIDNPVSLMPRKGIHMFNAFDEFAKALAQGLSRRQALYRLGGLFSASCMGWLGIGNKLNADEPESHDEECREYCHHHFHNHDDRKTCLNVCGSCKHISNLCGHSAKDLVCCQGTCCDGKCTNL